MATIGIDLGTQWTTTAAVVDGEVRLLGEPLPSVVTLAEGLAIGEDARPYVLEHPESSVDDVVRLLGRAFRDPEVTWLRQLRGSALVPADRGDAWLHVEGRDRSPEELVAKLLAEARRRAERDLGAPVAGAVITVPAFAGHAYRTAVLSAGRLAGFSGLQLAPAVGCAALSGGVGAHGAWAILDLGAGSLDVVIAYRDRDRLVTRAVAGDTLFGLRDLDRRLVEHLGEAIWRRSAVDVAGDARALAWLAKLAERVRLELDQSGASNALVIPELGTGAGRVGGFTLEPLEEEAYLDLVGEELDRLADACAWVLADAALGTDDLAGVAVVGGAARSRIVLDRVRHLFRQPPLAVTDRAAAARGAAMLAVESGRVEAVAPHSLGVKGPQGRMQQLIARNMPLPGEGWLPVTAPPDDAPSLVEIYEGEAELARDNRHLGRFVLDGLDGDARLGLHLDAHGLLTGTLDLGATSRPLTPHLVGGLHRDDEPREVRSGPTPRCTVSFSVPPSRRPRVRVSEPVLASHPPAREGGASSEVGARLAGTILEDRYMVESLLPGERPTYQARHVILGRIFSIEVLPVDVASDEVAARFVESASAAARIRSPYVIDVSDFGRLPDGTSYVVMEPLEGPSLAARLAAEGRLPLAVVVDVALQISAGLQAAHDVGVIHRNLGPASVALATTDERTIYKLRDFGPARARPPYPAPEQLTGQAVDERTDLFALGSLVHEMATGSAPFAAPRRRRALEVQPSTGPPAWSPPNDDPRWPLLEAVARRCLHERAAQRPSCARQVRQALLRLVA